MSRRRRKQNGMPVEMVVKLVLFGLLLLSLAIGGVTNFVPVFFSLAVVATWVIGGATVLLIVGGIVVLCVRRYRSTRQAAAQTLWSSAMPPAANSVVLAPSMTLQQSTLPPIEAWTATRIEKLLGEIDWYQFEKFCAQLLQSEGYNVERRGGAHPDGGVDLVAAKDGRSTLVQCKHWRTWRVQEKVIRELLGSMRIFNVSHGALYTLKGWTDPARNSADQHEIALVDGRVLAARARAQLSDEQLEALLNPGVHHCPRCESVMVWRTGDFDPFWGCSTFPRCRGVLRHTGAR